MNLVWFIGNSESWSDDTVLFTLIFSNSYQSLAFSEEFTKALAYSDHENMKVNFTKEYTRRTFALYQNIHNPMVKGSLIVFDLPDNRLVHMAIYDSNGQQILTRQLAGKAGTNNYFLDRSELLGASGLLYYQIATETFSATKKMLVTE